MKTSNLSYEEFKAKQGYSAYGFVDWAQQINESPRNTENDLIIPIAKKIESLPVIAQETIAFVEEELTKKGDIVKSIYYKPLDGVAAYLIKDPTFFHEFVISGFDKYRSGNACDASLHLEPFLGHPLNSREPREIFLLDKLMFEHLCHAMSVGRYFHRYLESSRRAISSDLLGDSRDRENLSELFFLISFYQGFMGDERNLKLARELERIRETENRLGGRKTKLLQKISEGYSQLAKDFGI